MAGQVISEDWIERQKNNFLWAIHRTFRKYQSNQYIGQYVRLTYEQKLLPLCFVWSFLIILTWFPLVVLPCQLFLPDTLLSLAIFYILTAAWAVIGNCALGILSFNIAEKSAMSDEQLKSIYSIFNYQDLADKLLPEKLFHKKGSSFDKDFAKQVIDVAKKILANKKSRLDYKTKIDKINEDFDVIELKIKDYSRKESLDSSLLEFFQEFRASIDEELQSLKEDEKRRERLPIKLHSFFRKCRQAPYIGKTINLMYKNFCLYKVASCVFLYFICGVNACITVRNIPNFPCCDLMIGILWGMVLFLVTDQLISLRDDVPEKFMSSVDDLKAEYLHFNYEGISHDICCSVYRAGESFLTAKNNRFFEDSLNSAKKILEKDKRRLGYKTTIDKINEDFHLIELKTKYSFRREKILFFRLEISQQLRAFIDRELQLLYESKILFKFCSLSKNEDRKLFLGMRSDSPIVEAILYHLLPIKGANLEDTKDENGEIIPGLRTEINRNYDRVREICKNIKVRRTIER